MSRRVFWSWLAIIAGLILVAQQLGWVAAGFNSLFWPSVLILWGVSRLSRNMGRNRLPHPTGKPTEAIAATSTSPDTFNVPIDPATHKTDIQIAPIASSLTIQPGHDDGTLIIGRADTDLARHVQQDNYVQQVHLSARTGDVGQWDFWLSPLLAHKLTLILGTGRSQVDLTSLDITTLTLDRSSGACTVLLPEAGDTFIKVLGGPGRLTFITSPTIALSVSVPDSTDQETQ